MNPSRILVTGATGFIGTKLVNELVKLGHKVVALTRKTSNKQGLENENIHLSEGDILDMDSLKRAMQGCDFVFHLAAYAKNWSKDPRLYYDFNVTGMMNVFNVAREFGVKKLVWTSTIVTFGPTPEGVVGNESIIRTTNRFFTDYERSKFIAEQEALKMARDDFPVVIVNPTRVYGPGKLTEGNSVTLLIDLYDRGKMPFLLNGGKNIGNYVLVDDLVQGHIQALERGKIGERYIIGGENASLKELFDVIDEISGKRHVRIPLPASIGLAYGKMQSFMAKNFGFYPQITPGWVETFLQDWAYSCEKAERELGYKFTPLKEGIRLTYEWITKQRFISKKANLL